MTTAKKKPGRRANHHEFNGKRIEGLARRPSDGRWRVIGTNITFTEPSEVRAIAKYYALKSGKQPEQWLRIVPGQPNHPDPLENFSSPLSVDEAKVQEFTETELWVWVAEQIRERPKYVAACTGIEEIGYLDNLKPPAPLPSFEELENVWMKHARCSELQRKKVRRAWEDFVETAEIRGLPDINKKTIVEYQDEVHSRIIARKDGTEGPMSGSQQMHLFTGVRRLIKFNAERAVEDNVTDTLNKTLGYMQAWKPSESKKNLNPNPIEQADWKKLLAAAEGQDKAMVLLMLNGAFYIQEVIRLEWDDIKDGCIVTHRKKRGECVRVCVLWPETIEALKSLERIHDRIFTTYLRLPIKACGAQRRFRNLAIKAGLCVAGDDGELKPTVTGSQLRDGAATAAASANVNSDLCKILRGHGCGIDDHYVKRNPKMVAPACGAIYDAYVRDSRGT
jgi:integrase